LKDGSFIHVSDTHLGYAQYNLEIRLKDFNEAFREVIDKTLELKPDFVLIAGDMFHHARPSNYTLEFAISQLKRLKDAGIEILAVDGSHDSAPNIMTGTIMNPLDRAGLIKYLPRKENACYENERFYIYGVPNFRSKRKAEKLFPSFLKEKPPNPKSGKFNIFMFHMTLDIKEIKPPMVEAELKPKQIPGGFDYYAGGHIHKPFLVDAKDIGIESSGVFAYSGCTETVSYDDAEVEKGFYYIEVNGKEIEIQRIKLESPRKFVVFKEDCTGLNPNEIARRIIERIKGLDEPEIVLIPILLGRLPKGVMRDEINLTKIKKAAKKALIVRPILKILEAKSKIEEFHTILEVEDLKSKVQPYLIEIFKERGVRNPDVLARAALELIDPLIKGDDATVKRILEGLV